MKMLKKFFVSILVATLIVGFSPVAHASLLEDFTGMIQEIILETLIGVGDGILYMVSTSVGELVTTDGLVYNEVEKVNINYWNVTDSGSVKGILAAVVNKWYEVFFTIAVIVYMMALVVAGIQVLLHSTAEKKAQYKEYFVSWVVGVGILCLFPYVMKYTIELCEAAVKTIAAEDRGENEPGYDPNSAEALAAADAKAAADAIVNSYLTAEKPWKDFGSMEFVRKMSGVADQSDKKDGAEITQENANSLIKNPMLQTRAYAQLRVNFVLLVVYFIMLGQMIVLLFVYYKRAFMLAFLITIFPLIAMTYAIDKMGDKKAQSFGIWFKEFVVNVVVQVFHAIVFYVVVSTSVEEYISNDGGNWLFMIISVLFLFQGEKILRNIFNVNSKANTLGTLAGTGLAMYGAVTSLGKKGGGNNIASEQDQKDTQAANQRQTTRSTMGADSASPTQVTDPSGGSTTGPSPSTQGPENSGQYRGNDPDGVAQGGFDLGSAQDTVLQGAMKRRLGRGFASGAANMIGSGVGGLMGATYKMAQGDKDGDGFIAGEAIAGAYAGSTIGKGVMTPVSAGINQLERRAEGNKLAKQIMSNEMDQTLGLDAVMERVVPPDVNPDEIAEKYGKTMQQIYREALAEMAKATARGGKAKGEMAFWNYIEQNTKK